MLCHTFHQSASRKAMKLKSLNDMHVIVYLKTYLQPKTITIIYKIFTKFKDLSTLKNIYTTWPSAGSPAFKGLKT